MKPPNPSKRPAARPQPPPLPGTVATIVALPPPIAIKQRLASHRNYSAAVRLTTQAIVLHCTDGCEGASKDDDVAAMFAAGDLAKRRSCHYVVDADSVTRCVPDALTAWHCGKHGNAVAIGIELCGRASQTRAQWLDGFSLPTLQIAARLVADLCAVHGVPPVVLDSEGLRTGRRGITTHASVSAAWGETTHTDPGEGFPLADFVAAVAKTCGSSELR